MASKTNATEEAAVILQDARAAQRNQDPAAVAQNLERLAGQIENIRAQIAINRQQDANYNAAFDEARIQELEIVANAYRMWLKNV